MIRPHSKEDETESGTAEERARRKAREGGPARSTHERPGVPDDSDLHWQRRELEEGWRHPHYEGFYDESMARERTASTEGPSASRHAHAHHPRERGEGSTQALSTAPGPESGKGPKGYNRSDVHLYEEVCERLTQHGQLDAREIKVSCENGEVVLRGSVKDEEARKLAEECALGVSGIRKVRNKLKLRSD